MLSFNKRIYWCSRVIGLFNENWGFKTDIGQNEKLLFFFFFFVFCCDNRDKFQSPRKRDFYYVSRMYQVGLKKENLPLRPVRSLFEERGNL